VALCLAAPCLVLRLGLPCLVLLLALPCPAPLLVLLDYLVVSTQQRCWPRRCQA